MVAGGADKKVTGSLLNVEQSLPPITILVYNMSDSIWCMPNCRRCHLWVGCRWCEVDEKGGRLDTPFCGKRSHCFFGMVGHPGPYSGW